MDSAGQSKKLDSLVTDLVLEVLPSETVLGVGIDIVEVRRIAALVNRPGGSFLGRSFTLAEIDECAGRAKPYIHYAERWAAKEGVYKALQLHWNRPFSWKEIEILYPGSGSGVTPQVNMSEQIREQIRREQGREQPRFLVSIFHTGEYSFAVALAIGPS